MDFDLTEEQRLLKESIRKFVLKECPKELVRELDEKEEFPDELYNKMAQLGWLGLAIDEKYGGMGGDILDMAIFLEELGRGMASCAFMFFLSSCFGGKSIGFYGSEEQKMKYLPGLCRGELRFALGLTEPDCGTDTLAISTTAEQDGDAFFVNGQKMFITGAHFSDYIITVVKTDKNPPKKSLGLSLLLIDAKSPGIEMKRVKKLGIKSVGTNEIFFTDVRVPAENLLGEKNKGWYHLVNTLNNERIGAAALCVGQAQAAFEDALDYSKQRYAFGKPIGQFQRIQHYLADMQTGIETARLLTYRAAWLQSKGKPCGVESSMAKLVASEVAFETICNGMQILGGSSYMMEYDMQRYYRDAKLMTIGPITNEMVRNYIAESMGLPKSY